MKPEAKVITGSVALGLLLWTGAAAVDSAFYSGQSYLDSLLLDVSPYEWTMRVTILLSCAAGGVICALLLKREREARKDLQRSESRFEAFMNNLPGVAFLRDGEGKYLFVNDGWAKVTGISREGALGKTAEDLFPPKVAAELREEDRKVLAGSDLYWDYYASGFGEKETQWLSSKFALQGGGPAGLVGGISVNVSAQVQAQRRLAEAESRYRTILQEMEEGFYEVDLEGNLTFVNRAFCRILGRTQEEIVGRSYRLLMDPAQAERTYRFFNEVFRTGAPTKAADWEMIRKNGSRVAIEASVSPIRISPTRWSGFRGILKDVTERRAAEAERARAKNVEMVAKLTEGVAHEVRNPLFAIQVNLEALSRRTALEPEARTHLDHVLDHVKRLDELVRSLLELGQAVAPGELRALDLGDVVRTAIGVVGDRSPDARSRIFLRDPVPSVRVLAEKRKAVLAFVHLLANAVEAAPEGADIHVGFSGEKDDCSVHIADSGPGIPPKIRETLFDPFVTTRPGHQGLGLALARHYVESHGGTVTAANNDPPPGATFTVRLPVAPS